MMDKVVFVAVVQQGRGQVAMGSLFVGQCVYSHADEAAVGRRRRRVLISSASLAASHYRGSSSVDHATRQWRGKTGRWSDE